MACLGEERPPAKRYTRQPREDLCCQMARLEGLVAEAVFATRVLKGVSRACMLHEFRWVSLSSTRELLRLAGRARSGIRFLGNEIQIHDHGRLVNLSSLPKRFVRDPQGVFEAIELKATRPGIEINSSD